MTLSSMSHARMDKAHTHSLGVTIKRFFLTKNFDEIKLFLAISEITFGYKNLRRVFSTCENIGGIFETGRQRLHRNCRARQIGHVGVTFPIGRLGVNRLILKLFKSEVLS